VAQPVADGGTPVGSPVTKEPQQQSLFG